MGNSAGPSSPTHPRRRCVGCGRIAPKPELMRIAIAGRAPLARDGKGAALVVHDREGRMPGRGAYLCRGTGPATPAQACLEKALRRGGIARALRTAVTVDPKLVESVSP